MGVWKTLKALNSIKPNDILEVLTSTTSINLTI